MYKTKFQKFSPTLSLFGAQILNRLFGCFKLEEKSGTFHTGEVPNN